MTKTVVALYDSVHDAHNAVEELVENGFDRSEISLVASDSEGRYGAHLERTGEHHVDAGEGAAAGAVSGAVFGGLAGILLGLGALVIPGLGPIIAAGPIVAGLTVAGVGAVAGGVVGALVGWGLPEEEAEIYAEGVRRGGTLVAARVPDSQADLAMDIMEDHNLIDIQQRADLWRNEGWTGYDPDASPYHSTTSYGDRDYKDFSNYRSDFLRHYQEYYTDTDYDYDYYEPGYRFGYAAATENQYRNRTWTDVEPDLRRRWETEYGDKGAWESFKDSVQYGWDKITGYDDDYDHDDDYRTHYQSAYANTGYDYDYYEPAYRYGRTLGTQEYYRDRDWYEIEPQVRQRWEERNQGTWEQFKDAVRHAWERVTGREPTHYRS